MKDFFAFRRMLAPWIIRVGYVIGLAIMVLLGIYDIVAPHQSASLGFAVLIGGPILLRLFFEIFIVMFTINETLTDIRNSLNKNESKN